MEIKEQIIVLVKSKKSKTINIKEIRENLNLKYTPQNEKILKNEIEKLVQERYIEPQKTSKTNVEGISEKYKIIKQDDANIKQEIINLSNKLKIDYYLKNTKEYQKDKEIINSISKFISKPIEGVLTINERSYQIFQNEKLLKEREDIIKKLGLTLQDLKCYETYEKLDKDDALRVGPLSGGLLRRSGCGSAQTGYRCRRADVQFRRHDPDLGTLCRFVVGACRVYGRKRGSGEQLVLRLSGQWCR